MQNEMITKGRSPLLMRDRRCVLILPGVHGIDHDLRERGADDGFLITRDIPQALAFAPSEWVGVAPGQWEAAPDPTFERARILDVARALAAATSTDRDLVMVDGSNWSAQPVMSDFYALFDPSS